MREPSDFTLGEIEGIFMREQVQDTRLIEAQRMLSTFLTNRETALQAYRVKAEMVKEEKTKPPKQKRVYPEKIVFEL